MKQLTATLAMFLFAAGSVASCLATEIILREHAQANSSILRLDDVADVVAGDQSELHNLLSAPLGPSPAPGESDVMSRAKVRDLLATAGADVGVIYFGGASEVMIASPDSYEASNRTSAGEVSDVTESMNDRVVSAIHDYLRTQSGREQWQIVLESEDLEKLNGVRGAIVVRGGKAPWFGRQRFEVTSPGNRRRVNLIARVEPIEMAVWAVRPIERGHTIGAADVEIRPYAGDLPSTACRALTDVVGKEAMQSVRNDSLVLSSQFRAPVLVRRGEQVEVLARAAGITVRTFASASGDGCLGDLTVVEDRVNRQRYSARVVGPQRVEVFASGASVKDYR